MYFLTRLYREPYHQQTIDYLNDLISKNPDDAIFLFRAVKTIWGTRQIYGQVIGGTHIEDLKIVRIKEKRSDHNVIYSYHMQKKEISLVMGFSGSFSDHEDEIKQILREFY